MAVPEPQAAPLPVPTGRSLNVVWLIVLITLAIVVIAGMLIIWALIEGDKEADVFVGFVGAALGALIGLIAPSPAGENG